ncbi:formin-like protein 5 [Miscanthus floridulus]|uniref:formin-like protein 5 n=1 Tax=Miscanthus floridulus TaxID=154761 RepID=UPI00345B1499
MVAPAVAHACAVEKTRLASHSPRRCAAPSIRSHCAVPTAAVVGHRARALPLLLLPRSGPAPCRLPSTALPSARGPLLHGVAPLEPSLPHAPFRRAPRERHRWTTIAAPSAPVAAPPSLPSAIAVHSSALPRAKHQASRASVPHHYVAIPADEPPPSVGAVLSVRPSRSAPAAAPGHPTVIYARLRFTSAAMPWAAEGCVVVDHVPTGFAAPPSGPACWAGLSLTVALGPPAPLSRLAGPPALVPAWSIRCRALCACGLSQLAAPRAMAWVVDRTPS